MDRCEIEISNLMATRGKLRLDVVCKCPSAKEISVPKIRLLFRCGELTRRLPLLVENYSDKNEECKIIAGYTFFLQHLFFEKVPKDIIEITFDVFYGDKEYINVPLICRTENQNGISIFENHIEIGRDINIKSKTFELSDLKNKSTIRLLLKRPFVILMQLYYHLFFRKPVVQNRVTFISGRRDELSGNQKFVYDKLKNRNDIDFQFLMFSNSKGHYNIKNISAFFRLYTTSKVIVIDDYFKLMNFVPKRKDVKIIQLWHACGAFKTFGFTRLGKVGGPMQIAHNHRMYDYAIVSSENVARHYAEGFGLPDKNIIATGVPRTDIFMNEEYKSKVRLSFYQKHPQLKNKKIILFAPTFRGNGQMSAFYPIDKFCPQTVIEELGDDYAIIIKLHPFCKEKYRIDEKNSSNVVDLSNEDELNDLLFVTDLLITDYSSAVFEASLLDIPMLFYAYDLDEYVADRDFYYDFRNFVPGKIVYNRNELIDCIKNNDFMSEKVDMFKNKFFDDIDGNSSQRVADKILEILEDK